MPSLEEIIESRVSDSEALELVLSIAYEAQDLFVKCGVGDDFCFQAIGSEYLIFGGTNRLKWTAKEGFELQTSHCTTKFLRAFHALKGV